MSLTQWLKGVWANLMKMKLSFLAFLVAFCLSFLSMGAIGLALLYLVVVALPTSLDEINQVSGDWFWPAIIMISMMWSFGFLIAGKLNLYLESKNTSRMVRHTIYITALWVWAYILWLSVLSTR